MRSFFLLLLLLLAPWSLHALPVDVRVGEHDDFTRLVFDLPPGTDWNLTRNPAENAVILGTNAENLQFDLSLVRERLGVDRVKRIRPLSDGATIAIDLACECEAKANQIGERLLIIEIRRTSPGEIVPIDPVVQEKPAEITPDIPEPVLIGGADPADLGRIRLEGQVGIGPMRNPRSLLPDLTLALPQQETVEDQANMDENPQSSLTPLDIGEQVIGDLASAATQGLLDPAVMEPRSGPRPLRENPASEPSSVSQPMQADLAGALSEGFTELGHETLRDRHLVIGGLDCVPDSALRLSNWVLPNTYIFDRLTETRGAVLGEFDKVDAEALQEHVKTQIYYGFGAEARSASLLDGANSDPVLNALSYLVDIQDDPTNMFVDQTSCNGPAALWSLLDTDRLKDGQSVNTVAVLRSYETLPKHLRVSLGPPLADRLSDFGYDDAARDLLRRLERSLGEATGRIALSRAKLDLKAGNAEQAEEIIRDLALSPGPDSMEAIKTAVEIAEKTGSKVPQAMLELAQAYSVETRGSPDGPVFRDAYFRMLIQNETFPEAFTLLSTSDDISPEQIGTMANRLRKALLASKDIPSFLTYSFRLDAFGVGSAELELGMIERMLDLGLPDPALDRLGRGEGFETTARARLLKARALLELERPEQAEALLQGLDGPEADTLYARARADQGDFATARASYSRLGQDQEALGAAWLSGEWSQVSGFTDSALAPVADLIRNEQLRMKPEDPSLAVANDLAAQSEASRSTIRDLLQATRIEAENME